MLEFVIIGGAILLGISGIIGAVALFVLSLGQGIVGFVAYFLGWTFLFPVMAVASCIAGFFVTAIAFKR